MRLLTLTTLYPNAAMPTHATFVENRLRRIVATGRVSARVIAPVPWFPLTWKMFGSYARFASVPRAEERHGIAISHPRFLTIPSRPTWQPCAYFRTAKAEVARVRGACWKS